MLTFSPVPHEYRWHGKPVPSVTQIIDSALGNRFADVAPPVMAYARSRGVAIHRACELDCRGELDDETVVDSIRPYLDAWRSFRRSVQFSMIATESPLYSPLHGIAGTPDLVFAIDGAVGVIDWKSGAASLRAGLQTAAYADMAARHYATGSRPLRRFSVHLQANGRPAIIEHNKASDWRDFLSCLNVHNLKMREAA